MAEGGQPIRNVHDENLLETQLENDRSLQSASVESGDHQLVDQVNSLCIKEEVPYIVYKSKYHFEVKGSKGVNIGDVTHHHHYYQHSPDIQGQTGDTGAQRAVSPRQLTAGPQNPKIDPRLRRKSDRYRTCCQEKTAALFVRTTPYCEAREVIERENSLLLIGGWGDGKSSVLHYLSAEPLHGYLPIAVSTPEEVQMYIDLAEDCDTNLLVFIDGTFGESYVQQNLVNMWLNKGKTLEMYLNRHKFVFAARQTVWMDCQVHLRESPFFCNVVEVTSAKLTEQDKLKMIEKYSGDTQKLTANQIGYITREAKPIAFCLCCKVMGDAIGKVKSGSELVDIFNRPFPFLRSELQKMADKDKAKYATLCLIMLCGGQLECEELTGSCTDCTPAVKERIEAVLDACGCTHLTCGDLQKCADRLIGSYLERIQDDGTDNHPCERYTFFHAAIHMAVVVEYGTHHFGHCLKHLHRDMIVKVARPQNYIQTGKPGEQEFIKVAATSYRALSEVFVEKAAEDKFDLIEVFLNPCIKEDAFQQFWCDYLQSRPDKLTAITNLQSKSLTEPNTCNSNRNCVLFFAAMSGAGKILNFLLNSGIECECHRMYCPVHGAAELNQTQIFTEMASDRLTDARVSEAIFVACVRGSMDVIELLLPRLNPENRDQLLTAGFVGACMDGRIKVVEYLLRDYLISCKGYSCCCHRGLIEASKMGFTFIVTLLLSHGADVNMSVNGFTCLHLAANAGQTETVGYLLTHGATINARNRYGGTSLHNAALRGHTQTVRCLVSHGADMNDKNHEGESSLQLAAREGNVDTVCYLIRPELGADVNAQNNYGVSPLHHLARFFDAHAVSELLANGGDVNMRDRWGQTPLHALMRSTFKPSSGILDILLQHGTDVNLRDKWDKSALDLAAREEGATILEVFNKYGHIRSICGIEPWPKPDGMDKPDLLKAYYPYTLKF